MTDLGHEHDLSISVNKIYKQALWSGLRFPENMSFAEDLFVQIDILGRANKIVYTSDGLYYYWERLSSASFNMTKEKINSDIIAKQKLLNFMKRNKVDVTMPFDLLFGAYVKAWEIAPAEHSYLKFFMTNFFYCITKPKCIIFLLSPKLYFRLK